MASVCRKAEVPYSVEEMFSLVQDVNSYSEFIKLKSLVQEVLSNLEVNRNNFYISKNTTIYDFILNLNFIYCLNITLFCPRSYRI